MLALLDEVDRLRAELMDSFQENRTLRRATRELP
jgi:hypothetical protein